MYAPYCAFLDPNRHFMIALSGSLSISALHSPAPTTKYASDSDSHPDITLTPADTPCETPSKTSKSNDLALLDFRRMSNQARMDGTKTDGITTEEGDRLAPGGDGSAPKAELNEGTLAQGGNSEKCNKKHKHEHLKKKTKKKACGKKPKKETEDDDTSSSDSSSSEGVRETSDSDSDLTSDTDSEEERRLRKQRRRKAHRESRHTKHRRRGKPWRHQASSESESSSESYDEDEDEGSDISEQHVSRKSKGSRSRKNRSKRRRKEAQEFDDEGDLDPVLENLQVQMLDLDARLAEATMAAKEARHVNKTNKNGANGRRKGKGKRAKHRYGSSSRKDKRASRLEYKRVDQRMWLVFGLETCYHYRSFC